MRYRIYSLAALANLLPHFTLADFVIYAGQSNNYDLVGASDQTNLLSIYPYTPDCGMVGNDVPFTNYNNDLDIGGYACDGCSDAVAVKDWYITRLEFNNGPDAIGGSQPTLSYATGDRICECASVNATSSREGRCLTVKSSSLPIRWLSHSWW